MLLRPRSGDGPLLTAKLLPSGKGGRRFPMLQVGVDLTLSLEAALTNYEVIGATDDERRILQQWGHPFGGVQ